jgi:glycosyltransferase involved in cell wall biosynthesis
MGQHKTRPRRAPLTVAVAIPTIPGREALYRRAVASVHAQTRRPDRILVQRDDARLGAADARNKLLERAADAGIDVIAWLDDDDWLRPTHLRACMRVLEDDPGVDLVYPRPVMADGHPDPTAVTHQGVFPTSPWGLRFCDEFADHIRELGSFIPMTHLVRVRAAVAAGGFPPGRTVTGGRLVPTRYQGEDERYLIAMLDQGARFEHLDSKTWVWWKNPASTAGRGDVRPALSAAGAR